MRHSYIAGYDLCMREGERGVGGVSSKYFWLTQYWLLLVTLVQLSQLFSIFTTSPRSPNHSQSRVCKYLTLIELNSPFSGWRRHLWDACSLSPGVWGQTININTPSINIFSIFLAFASAVVSVSWCVDSAGPGACSELTLPWPRLGMFALVTFDHHQTFICVITWKQIVETKNYRNVKLFEIQLNIKCCESLRSTGIFNLTFSDYKT